MDRLLRERKVRELMLAGVTIEKPETVTIDADVTIGMDTVDRAVRADPGQNGDRRELPDRRVLHHADSVLADEVEIGPFTLVGRSHLERGAHAGPFARLRMENHVEPGAHVGNFVELKKTRLGAESKAMHLAYLGDSTIGAGVNIGAGTITCNYDGVEKHPTKIARWSLRRQQLDAGGARRDRRRERILPPGR